MLRKLDIHELKMPWRCKCTMMSYNLCVDSLILLTRHFNKLFLLHKNIWMFRYYMMNKTSTWILSHIHWIWRWYIIQHQCLLKLDYKLKFHVIVVTITKDKTKERTLIVMNNKYTYLRCKIFVIKVWWLMLPQSSIKNIEEKIMKQSILL